LVDHLALIPYAVPQCQRKLPSSVNMT